MPIYEFYCQQCHMMLSFFARKVDTSTQPECPHCASRLSREVSQVSYLQGGGDGDEDGLGDVRIDEDRMERAMEALGGEIDNLGDNDDPREAATLMRKFTEMSGLRFNRDIEDALQRMESGEDPDSVGADLDAMMESGAEPFVSGEGPVRRLRHILPARRDSTLYDLIPDK